MAELPLVDPPALTGTVLLVDDDEDVRRIAAVILREFGLVVIEVSDAAAALEVLTDPERIDLLVTDLTLGGMGGLELAQLAKTIKPDIRVLYVSGRPHDVGNDPESLHGPLIQKPWGPAELRSLIGELLPRQDPGAARR